MVCNNANVGGTCQSNSKGIHMDGRRQGFPAEHRPKHHTDQFLLLLRGPVLMRMCPLLVLIAVHSGQHGHPDWSAAMQPHMQQTAVYCAYSFLSEPALTSSAIWARVICLLDQTTQTSLHSPPCCQLTTVPFLHHFWYILTTADQEHPTRAEVWEIFWPSCPVITIWPGMLPLSSRRCNN